MSGVARQIKYNDSQKVLSITEGEIERGFFIKFVRIIDFRTPNQINIKTGYWDYKNSIMAPHGKFSWL